jgi:hypothetical protein
MTMFDGNSVPSPDDELIGALETASALLRRNPEIAAVHIVDPHVLDGEDQRALALLFSVNRQRLGRPHEGVWSLAREDEVLDPAPPRPSREAVRDALAAWSRWSAGFEGLTEGAR